mmetsp:Transcript_29612/g.102057  ORF Transcript_29612/g.102057 Transcript_29612/m.102057 type:complete len:366 (+) Transcript_29612:49-1146(+)
MGGSVALRAPLWALLGLCASTGAFQVSSAPQSQTQRRDAPLTVSHLAPDVLFVAGAAVTAAGGALFYQQTAPAARAWVPPAEAAVLAATVLAAVAAPELTVEPKAAAPEPKAAPPPPAPPPPAFKAAAPARVVTAPTKACFSGCGFSAMKWPAPPLKAAVPAPRKAAARFERAAWSGSIFASATRKALPPTAADLAADKRLQVAKVLLKLKRAPPPPMERVAWSGVAAQGPRARRTCGAQERALQARRQKGGGARDRSSARGRSRIGDRSDRRAHGVHRRLARGLRRDWRRLLLGLWPPSLARRPLSLGAADGARGTPRPQARCFLCAKSAPPGAPAGLCGLEVFPPKRPRRRAAVEALLHVSGW